MQATATSLLALLQNPNQFIIPIYQRSYAWTIKECEKLLNDILKITTDQDVNSHFMSSIVYYSPVTNNPAIINKYWVIDGQQRLTTITLLIAALADFVGNDTEYAQTINMSKNALVGYYLLNQLQNDDSKYKLLLTDRNTGGGNDRNTLTDLLDNLLTGSTTFRNPQSQIIIENYEFFRGKINNINYDSIWEGLRHLFVVSVIIERNIDNPQVIFESLNGTGLNLTKTDLIRNYILMGHDVPTQIRLYDHYWDPIETVFNKNKKQFDDFFRYYLTIINNIMPKIDEIYDVFKSSTPNTSISDIEHSLNTIKHYSELYEKLVFDKEQNTDLKYSFKRILQLNMNVCYPFLLKVYDDYNNKKVRPRSRTA